MIQGYLDPRLAHSPRRYEEFISDLHAQHLIKFTQAPRAHCGAFFVVKKDGAQRMICDCRAANQFFRRSPNMEIGNGASLSRVRYPADKHLYVAQFDVQAYFYRCGIEDALGEFFVLPEVPEALMRRLTGNTDELLPGAWFPHLCVLPMGFTWAFWIAQRLHR